MFFAFSRTLFFAFSYTLSFGFFPYFVFAFFSNFLFILFSHFIFLVFFRTSFSFFSHITLCFTLFHAYYNNRRLKNQVYQMYKTRRRNFPPPCIVFLRLRFAVLLCPNLAIFTESEPRHFCCVRISLFCRVRSSQLFCQIFLFNSLCDQLSCFLCAVNFFAGFCDIACANAVSKNLLYRFFDCVSFLAEIKCVSEHHCC